MFKKLFRRRKKNTDGEYADSSKRYAPLREDLPDSYREYLYGGQENGFSGATAEEAKKKHRSKADKKYLVELCERLIDTAKELEDIRKEYDVVSSYLNDIQIIEKLPEEKRSTINETAKMISNLDTVRNQFLQADHRLSDVQFSQMQDEEDEIPSAIKRFQANEAYLDAIGRDMKLLEGEKMEWTILRNDMLHEQKILRRLSVFVFSLFVLIVVILAVFAANSYPNSVLYMFIAAFAATLYGAYAILRYQECARQIKQSDVNKNHAVSLENHAKFKYVNIKNAVEYACAKYHVHNSYELIYLYEQYQEAVRERERFRQTSDDLARYSQKLVELLRAENLYDSKIWIHYCNALNDKKEMVELNHDFYERRQKLRAQMESYKTEISQMRSELELHAYEFGDSAKIVAQIIRRIDQLGVTE